MTTYKVVLRRKVLGFFFKLSAARRYADRWQKSAERCGSELVVHVVDEDGFVINPDGTIGEEIGPLVAA